MSPTSDSPLSRMLAAIRVKSPFSQSALFGFILLLLGRADSNARSSGKSDDVIDTRRRPPGCAPEGRVLRVYAVADGCGVRQRRCFGLAYGLAERRFYLGM